MGNAALSTVATILALALALALGPFPAAGRVRRDPAYEQPFDAGWRFFREYRQSSVYRPQECRALWDEQNHKHYRF